MTTTNTRYVDPDAAAGGDGTTNGLSGGNCAYVSLSAWEAARQGNLTIGDIIELCYCCSNGASHTADTTAVTISGWTTDATRYIDVRSEVSHGGKWNTSVYRLLVADSSCILSDEDYMRYDGLQVGKSSSSANGQSCFNLVGGAAGANDQRISNCILRQAGNASYSEQHIHVNASGAIVSIWNTIMYGAGANAASSNSCINVLSAAVLSIYSTTMINGYYYAVNAPAGATTTCKNCYGSVQAGGGGAFSNVDTMVTCSSSDSSGTLGLRTIAVNATNFTNVTAGSEDFHLPSGSALVNVGTDTSGDAAPFNFTTDIDGETRSGTWDIGADEYVAGGTGSSIPINGKISQPSSGSSAGAFIPDGVSTIQYRRMTED